MEIRIEEFLRWVQARGVEDERLLEYRECALELLYQAAGEPIEASHLAAARSALVARGTRPRAVARLDEVVAALRRYQRPPTPRPGPAPPAPPVTSPVASVATPSDSTPDPRALRGKRLALALGASTVVLVCWVGGVYAYFTRERALDPVSAGESVETSPEEAAIHGVYRTFHEAMLAGDAARLRTVLAAEKLSELSAPGAEQTLEIAKSMYPPKVDLGRAVVQGDSAVLDVRGSVADQRMKGRVELHRQGGSWKVGNVSFKVTFGEEEKPEQRKAERPAEAEPAGAVTNPEPPSRGEATLVVDGVSEVYELQTRFESRVPRPEEATFVFQVRAPEHSNARRIMLTLDATHVGSHQADGQAIFDSMFNEKPLTIGRASSGGYSVNFQWIADGGQHYPPKNGTRCEVRVTSAYTGTDDGEFTAEIPRCHVHSAGIDRTLTDVKLRVRGKI